MKKNADRLCAGETKSIGILSAGEGEGSTTMAIAMGTYLSGVKRLSVAIAEIGRKPAFPSISEVYYGDTPSGGFRLFDADYYSVSDTSGLAWIYGRTYDFVIIDFGAGYEKYIEEIIRCSMKLVIGSVNLWRYEAYLTLCRYIRKLPGHDGWLHIISGDGDDVKEHCRRENVMGIRRVQIDNPYVMENAQLSFFQKIL